ncbi:MAG: hypothetical protein NVS4B7_09270 [Ktedonobacteraceae bacterium]
MIMTLTNRKLLRLHIEAVWNVQLSPMHNDMHILPVGTMPAWSLYVAQLTNERIHIWRPDIDSANYPTLLARAYAAFSLPSTDVDVQGLGREVALQLAAQPTLDITTARQIAQPITSFSDLEKYHFTLEQDPVIGVINEGQLLCAAHSARRTAYACELGIDTQPEVRRKGYALAATVLWTVAVVSEGLVPLYSAFVENVASLKLAAAAGYREFARAVYIVDET